MLLIALYGTNLKWVEKEIYSNTTEQLPKKGENCFWRGQEHRPRDGSKSVFVFHHCALILKKTLT